MFKKFSWYVRRARTMSPSEVVRRAGGSGVLLRFYFEYLSKYWRRRADDYDLQRFSFCTLSEPTLDTARFSMDGDERMIAAALRGEFAFLGHAWKWNGDGAIWAIAPDSGKRWPPRFFAGVPYRPGNPFGDVRLVWEPSRLQHLVVLALVFCNEAASSCKRETALRQLCAQLESWVDENPPLAGVHYTSMMECALRIISVCHIADMARAGIRSEAVWRKIILLVESHARLIASNLSLYSSTGNHTVAEATGLLYAGYLFPEFAAAEHWRNTGLQLLTMTAEQQVLADGGGLEQTFWYLSYILDLYALSMSLLRVFAVEVPTPVEEAWLRGVRFLRTFASRPGELPAIGDCDSGWAVSPYFRATWVEEASCVGRVVVFEQTGLTRVHCPANNVVVLLDHGRLGMPPAYGHGHADALSVVLQIANHVLLIDPGTYGYGAERRWRRYFRGTSAHNTVTVDGCDQAVQEAHFLWSNPYQAELAHREVLPDGRVTLLAWHDGYWRMGVIHWRALVCLPGGTWLVWDRLEGLGSHRLDLHWHVDGTVEVGANALQLHHKTGSSTLSINGGALRILCGEKDPPCGWISRGYGSKEPIETLRATWTGLLPHEFTTLIALHGKDRLSPAGLNQLVAELRVLAAEAGAAKR